MIKRICLFSAISLWALLSLAEAPTFYQVCMDNAEGLKEMISVSKISWKKGTKATPIGDKFMCTGQLVGTVPFGANEPVLEVNIGAGLLPTEQSPTCEQSQDSCGEMNPECLKSLITTEKIACKDEQERVKEKSQQKTNNSVTQ